MDTIFLRTPKFARKNTPKFLKKWIKSGAKKFVRSGYLKDLYLKGRSTVDNVYHCCTHKSASQWVKALITDLPVFLHTGMDHFHYQSEWMEGYDLRPLDERYISRPFPKNTVASPLYMHYDCFEDLPKPNRYKAFFIMRDPRDLVISYYYSMKKSHPLNPGVAKLRKELNNRDKKEGLKFTIEYMSSFGFFATQKSWKEKSGENEKIFRYEDLTGENQIGEIKRLFEFCDLKLPNAELKDLIERHKFENKSDGRKRGESDDKSHLRKGVPGDWKNHFDREILEVFKEKSGDVVAELSYKSAQPVDLKT